MCHLLRPTNPLLALKVQIEINLKLKRDSNIILIRKKNISCIQFTLFIEHFEHHKENPTASTSEIGK